ncbi:hypothetical protein BUALT_Bualt17G0099600 [Buddleja alternifolia]|uniref:Oxidoreductase N-terminal domain-containing protein n=1 Tax=Buddleja alternifolia TaxID=168488 RepID=A0AAV6W7K7_9LAMI|nr:hypothetical protein BUALT_Bualt17G0099600 [Buddleja alternifolia]
MRKLTSPINYWSISQGACTLEKMEMRANKQIILKNYVQGFPKENDFELKTTKANTEIPKGSKAALVKNLYLACDPYMCHLMRPGPPGRQTLFPVTSFLPGNVIKGYGVAKVIKSAHPELKEGDYVWGGTGWEEYSLLMNPEKLVKIKNTDFPLSYYAGILGDLQFHLLDKIIFPFLLLHLLNLFLLPTTARGPLRPPHSEACHHHRHPCFAFIPEPAATNTSSTTIANVRRRLLLQKLIIIISPLQIVLLLPPSLHIDHHHLTSPYRTTTSPYLQGVAAGGDPVVQRVGRDGVVQTGGSGLRLVIVGI